MSGRRGSINDQVESVSIVGRDYLRGYVGHPLLWNDLSFPSNGFAGDPDPRAFHGATATSEKSRPRTCRFVITECIHFVTATWT